MGTSAAAAAAAVASRTAQQSMFEWKPPTQWSSVAHLNPRHLAGQQIACSFLQAIKQIQAQ
eukprot:357270-Chlamydomonas_euryale.AAC.16